MSILGGMFKSGRSLENNISNLFKNTSIVSSDLSRRLIQFVIEGSNENVLIDLKKYGNKIEQMLGYPGINSSYTYSYNLSKLEKDQIKQAQQSRDHIYRNATINDLSKLYRLSKIYEAVNQKQDKKVKGVPISFRLLINDFLVTLYASSSTSYVYFSSNGIDAKTEKVLRSNRSLYTLYTIFELGKIEGLTKIECIRLLLFKGGGYAHPIYIRLNLKNDFINFIENSSKDFASIIPSLDTDSAVEALSIIYDNNMADMYSDEIILLAVSGSKIVRGKTDSKLKTMSSQRRLENLTKHLNEGSASIRKNAALLISQYDPQQGRAVLLKCLEEEKTVSVKIYINNLLNEISIVEQANNQTSLKLPDYAELPETILDDDFIGEMWSKHLNIVENAKRQAEEEKINNAQQRDKRYIYNWAERHYKDVTKLNKNHYSNFLNVLNGKITGKINQTINQVLYANPQLVKRDDFGIYQILRYIKSKENRSNRAYVRDPIFIQWILHQSPQKLDLRQFIKPAISVGYDEMFIAETILSSYYRPDDILDHIPADGIWPFFVNNTKLIGDALKTQSGSIYMNNSYKNPETALEIISLFPEVPPELIAQLFPIALGTAKLFRVETQDILSNVPGIQGRVEKSLNSRKMEERLIAAKWISRRGWTEFVPVIKNALKKEKKELVQAIFLSALDSLGEPMNEFFSKEQLIKAAENQKDISMPKDLNWLEINNLPQCKWNDGESVSKNVLRWWVILAFKMKEPEGSYLQLRQLTSLDKESRNSLGLYLLNIFTDYDTKGPTDKEAQAYAETNTENTYNMYQQWAKSWGEAYGNRTREMVYQELYRNKLGDYLGSGINAKGILALCRFAPGAEAVAIIQSFIKNHYTRYHQLIALLSALSSGNDSLVIQLILSLARRYRTASVKEKARELVEKIATNNNWTKDELADRTIPTGGLDEDGTMVLDFGRRQFSVKLSDNFKPLILNQDGKVLKNLPSPTAADDKALAKGAKTDLSALKKALKQVSNHQSTRLYESMCSMREWPVKDWLEYLIGHPIMRLLIQKVIWKTDEGVYFRPMEDLSFVDVEDEEISLEGAKSICIAHSIIMDNDKVNKWHEHIKSYNIKLLFNQLNTKEISLKEFAGKTSVEDRVGWLSDTFTLRGLFSKRGFQRGPAEDGGCFFIYFKEFSSLGYRVEVEFSGSMLPEENVPAALKNLVFYKKLKKKYNAATIDSIPPILASEVIKDYYEIADGCSGYDPDWEKKMPW